MQRRIDKYDKIALDMLVTAREVVRYVGQPAAGDSLDIAKEATGLIDVECKERASVFDVEEAWATKASVSIHPNLLSCDGQATVFA